MTFTLIVLILIFALVSYYYWKGHSGYWKQVVSLYKNTKYPQKNLITFMKSQGFCFYRESQLNWNSYNSLQVIPEAKGLYIKDGFFGLCFPSVLIPWKNIQIIRTEEISLLKKLVLKFDDCSGEFAIPLWHKSKIYTYANKTT